MGDFINRLRSGLTEFWNGLEKGQRLRIVIAGILSMVIIIGFVIYASKPQMEILNSYEDKAQAGQVMAKLKELGVNSTIEGTTIYVPKGKADGLQAQLAAEGLDGSQSLYPDQPAPVSMFDTSEDKQQRYLTAKENKIRRGLIAIKGVQFVDVTVTMPSDDAFMLEQNKRDATASIMMIMKKNASPLDKNQIEGIVQFISKSVEGLKPENIAIMDGNGNSIVGNQGGLSGQFNTQNEMTKNIKSDIEDSIKKFLESVFGANNVKVAAAVKLDFNNETTNQTEYIPTDTEKKAGIVKSMETIKKTWVDASNGGTPGTDTNTQVPEYPTTDGSKADYNEASDVINYSISEIQKQIVKEVGNIQSLSVSVLLNPGGLKPEALADKDQLTTIVQDLVKYAIQGFSAPEKQLSNNIKIQIMPFNDDAKKAIEESAKRQKDLENRDMLIKIVSAVIAMLVFAAVMFLFLRRGSTSQQKVARGSTAVGAESAMATLEQVAVAEIEIDDKNEVKKKIEKFVGQKPDAVAQLLKSWLSEE